MTTCNTSFSLFIQCSLPHIDSFLCLHIKPIISVRHGYQCKMTIKKTVNCLKNQCSEMNCSSSSKIWKYEYRNKIVTICRLDSTVYCDIIRFQCFFGSRYRTNVFEKEFSSLNNNHYCVGNPVRYMYKYILVSVLTYIYLMLDIPSA